MIALTAYGETGGEDVEKQPGYYRRRYRSGRSHTTASTSYWAAEAACAPRQTVSGYGLPIGRKLVQALTGIVHIARTTPKTTLATPTCPTTSACRAPGCTHTHFIEVHHVKERENRATQISRICCPCVPRAIHW